MFSYYLIQIIQVNVNAEQPGKKAVGGGAPAPPPVPSQSVSKEELERRRKNYLNEMKSKLPK